MQGKGSLLNGLLILLTGVAIGFILLAVLSYVGSNSDNTAVKLKGKSIAEMQKVLGN